MSQVAPIPDIPFTINVTNWNGTDAIGFEVHGYTKVAYVNNDHFKPTIAGSDADEAASIIKFAAPAQAEYGSDDTLMVTGFKEYTITLSARPKDDAKQDCPDLYIVFYVDRMRDNDSKEETRNIRVSKAKKIFDGATLLQTYACLSDPNYPNRLSQCQYLRITNYIDEQGNNKRTYDYGAAMPPARSIDGVFDMTKLSIPDPQCYTLAPSTSEDPINNDKDDIADGALVPIADGAVVPPDHDAADAKNDEEDAADASNTPVVADSDTTDDTTAHTDNATPAVVTNPDTAPDADPAAAVPATVAGS